MPPIDLKYSCFISYRHPQNEDDLTKSFVEELNKALKTYISPLMSLEVFIDEERLKPGYLFKEALAEAICQSVCLIVVYTPKYFDENATYCAPEYKAMIQLEEQRKQIVANRKTGFIIPVVFRGPKDIPAELKNDRLYCDFSEYTLVEADIRRNPKYVQKINEVAEYISDTYKLLRQVNNTRFTQATQSISPCEEFPFPNGEEKIFKDWLATICGSKLPRKPRKLMNRI